MNPVLRSFSSQHFCMGLNQKLEIRWRHIKTGSPYVNISKCQNSSLNLGEYWSKKFPPQIEVKLRTMEGASAGSQHSPLASSIERQGGCMSGSVTPPLPKLYRGRPLAWENKFHAPPEAP